MAAVMYRGTWDHQGPRKAQRGCPSPSVGSHPVVLHGPRVQDREFHSLVASSLTLRLEKASTWWFSGSTNGRRRKRGKKRNQPLHGHPPPHSVSHTSLPFILTTVLQDRRCYPYYTGEKTGSEMSSRVGRQWLAPWRSMGMGIAQPRPPQAQRFQTSSATCVFSTVKSGPKSVGCKSHPLA